MNEIPPSFVCKRYKAGDVYMGVVTQQVWDNDKKRVEQLKMGGKQVYVIWETSWKINKNNIIKDLNRLYEDKRGDKAKKD